MRKDSRSWFDDETVAATDVDFDRRVLLLLIPMPESQCEKLRRVVLHRIDDL